MPEGYGVIRPMADADADAVLSIYADGIATGNATFVTDLPSWSQWDQTHLPAPRLVWAEGDAVLGWAALSPVSARFAYRGVAEVSLYVAAATRGRGIGRSLLAALVAGAEQAGLWTLQAGIFPENVASLAVHAACGFRTVGRRERIGQLGPAWRDVLLLERRSQMVGQS